MQVRIRSGVALLVTGFALATGVAMAADAPKSAGDCFQPAFMAGDADAVAACYAEDGIIWFPGGPMAKGRAAIRDGFAGYFEHVAIKDAKLTAMGQETMGDIKVSWGTYVFTVMDKDTQAESVLTGRYTDIQKLIDGKWLYTVDHPSDDPAPAAE